MKKYRVYYPLIAITILFVPLLVYYFPYVSGKQLDLTNRSFRALSLASHQIQEKLDDFGQVLMVVDDNPEYIKDLVRELKYEPCRKRQDFPEQTAMTINPEPEGYILDLWYTPQKASAKQVCAETEVEKIIAPFISQIPEEAFDDVLLFDSEGRTVFQRSKAGVHLTSIRSLFPEAKTDDAKQKKPDTEMSATLPRPANPESSQLVEVPLAGVNYKAFLEPIPLRLVHGQNVEPGIAAGSAETSKRSNLVLCGLVRSDRFRSQSLSVPGATLTWPLLGFAAILVLGWPLLKVHTASPMERMRPRESLLLALSIPAGASLLTLVLLHAAILDRDDPTDRLKDLADQMDANLGNEIRHAVATLNGFTTSKTLASEIASPVRKDPDGEPLLKPVVNLLSMPGHEALAYPYFDHVFWTNGDGQQRAKWTTKRQATPKSSGLGFPYFDNVIVGRLWTLAADRQVQFYVEPWYSTHTGDYLAIISTPIADLGDLKVGAIVTSLASVVQPVLPPGFGYAIIDQTGLVQFHSEASRNLLENFFHECERADLLRGAVSTGAFANLDVKYKGIDRRVYVTPLKTIENAPWTLIVFRDTDGQETQHLEVILLFLVLAAIYALVLGAIVAILMWRLDASSARQVWPRASRAGAYRQLLITYSLIAAAECVGIWAASPLAILLGTLMVPLFAIGASWLVLRSGAEQDSVDSRPGFETMHALAATVLVFVVGVIPCIGLLRISFDYQNRLSAIYDRLEVDKALEERKARIRSAYRFTELGAGRDNFLTHRQDLSRDRYDSIRCSPCAQDPADDAEARSEARMQKIATFTAYLPDKAASATRELAHSMTAEQWASSVGPRERQSFSLNGWVMSGLAFLAMGAFFWIRWTAKKLVGLKLREEELQAFPVWQPFANQPERNFLVLQLGRPGEKLFLKERTNVHWVDVSETARRNNWTVYPGAAPTVVLGRFEFQMDDPAISAGKLTLLENLLFTEKKIVIFSLIDPMFYWFEGGQTTQQFSPQERDRWTRVFSVFSTQKWEPKDQEWTSPEARHSFLWSTCSRTEKLVLFQLAKDGWVNPENTAAIRHLAQRSLIRRDQRSRAFEVCEKDFGGFVASALDAGQYAAMSPENANSAWRGWKFAMLMAVLLMLIFVFFAWQEFFEGGLGWIAASLTALPTALKAASQIRSRFQSTGISIG